MARPRYVRVLLVITLAWLGWAGWFVATGSGEFAVHTVDEEGESLPGVTIHAEGDEIGATDASGAAEVEWTRSRNTFTFTAAGYHPTLIELDADPTAEMTVRMSPQLLRGEVRDPDGRPVPDVRVRSGHGEAVTDRTGTFVVRRAEPGPVSVWRPAWESGDFSWDGSPGARTIEVAPRVLKAVHVSGDAAREPGRWAALLEMTVETELNAVMLDLKGDDGFVFYDTQVATAHEAGAVVPGYDLAQIVRETKERDLYLIGRIVTFQDPVVARAIPAMAVGNRNTGGVYQKGGQYFLDPTNPRAREYGLALAEEACRLGVDEIQFDYVRYPDGFGDEAVFYGGSDSDTRVVTIRSFLAEARAILNDLGCAVAADIFGFITTATDDGGIGQQWEALTEVLDVASPMLYPSHYASGWYGFERPVDHPGPMVRRALEDGIDRLRSGVVVRPWLQDFGYTDEQVRAQIEAAEEFGLGWMLWNAHSIVSVGALEPTSGR